MFTCDWQMQVQTRLLLHQQRELYHPEYQVQLSRLYRVKGKEIKVSFCQTLFNTLFLFAGIHTNVDAQLSIYDTVLVRVLLGNYRKWLVVSGE